MLEIYLFEPLQVLADGQTAIDTQYARRKAKAMFVYLFLHRGCRVSKYRLLADLWPSAEDADPGRVKHTIQILRAAVEGPRAAGNWQYIVERFGFYFFNPDAPRYSDLEEFDSELSLARQAARGAVDRLDHYRRALRLRRGAFLAEFRYDDWAAAEIARVGEQYLQALDEAAALEAAEGEYAAAIELLRTAIAEDPLHESSYVDLMRYLFLEGRRTDALRTYLRLQDVLARTLGVAPQAQAAKLNEAIRGDRADAV